MSDKEPTKEELEKTPGKSKQSTRIEVKQTSFRKDSTKIVPGSGGLRHQDVKTGRYRSPISPGSISGQSPKKETKVGLSRTAQYEEGGFKASATVSATPTEVGLKGKVEYSPYSKGPVTVKLGAVQAEATFSQKGVGFGAEVTGPTVSVKAGKKICIGKTTSVDVGVEVGVGVGLGAKAKVSSGPNKTNSTHRVTLEGALGTGKRVEGKVDLDVNTDDFDCTPSVFDADNTAFPTPQPNAPTPSATQPSRGPASVSVELPEMDEAEEAPTPLPTPAVMRSEISRGLASFGADEEAITLANQELTSDEALENTYRHVSRAVTIDRIAREEYTHRQIVGLGQTFDFLQNLGGQLRCEPLSKAAVVGKHLLNAYETYSKISKMGIDKFLASGVGSVLGGLATFGGSFLGIIGAFFGGPDPTQLILDAIQGVSDQVRRLDTDMREYFRLQANQQEHMYRQMMKGFDLLHTHLETGITSIRADIAASFEHLERQINFMTQLMNRGQQAILLQPLTELCDEVTAWRTGKNNGDPKQQIPRLANQLFSHFKSLATNSYINGLSIWEIYCRDGMRPEIVSDFLKLDGGAQASHRSEDFNWCLSYLASYAIASRENYLAKKQIADPKPVDYKPSSLPNPIVQFRALDSYLLLKHAYPVFDNDPSGEDLVEIERHLRRSIKFIEDLKTDEILFQSLVFDYYEALQNIKTLLDQYTTYESNEITTANNRDYTTHDAEVSQAFGFARQGEITWNFCNETPDQFILKFANRRINYITHDVAAIDTVKDAHPQYSKKRLYAMSHAGTDSGLMTVCAGEYLKLWNFTAAQSKESGGRTWIYKYWVPAIHLAKIGHFAYPRELAEGEKLQHHSHTMWDPTSPAYPWGYPREGVGRGAKPYSTDAPPALALSDPDWIVDFDLKSGNEVAIHYTFKESWGHVPPVPVNIWTDTDALWVKKIGGKHYVSYGEDGQVFQNGLKGRIFERYNSDAATVTGAVSVPNAAALKSRLEAHIFSKRQMVARNLQTGTADGAGQTHVNAFRKALLKLDEVVALIKWYGVLVGKDMNHAAFKELISSSVIDQELKDYHSATTRDFARVFSPSLVQALSTRPTQEAALAVTLMGVTCSTASSLPKKHPTRILDQALKKLQMFQQWRKLIVLEFPELADSSLEEYDLRCQIYGEQIFQETTHALLREINQKSYAKARFQVQNHMKYSTKMQASTYAKIFDECVRFTCVDSSTAVSVGQEVVVGCDLDDIKTQQCLSRIYRSGTGIARWAPHIGFLMDVFNRSTKNEPGSAIPPNFMIWSEGILTFLKLLFNEKLESVSAEAGYTLDGKIKALGDCLQAGLTLKKFIYHLALSPDFFNILFFEYEKHLAKLKLIVERIANQYPNNDAEVFRQFSFQSGGQSHKNLDGLASRAIVLALLIEMLFERDLRDDSEFKRAFQCFRDRDGLMSLLRESASNTYSKNPLLKRFDILLERLHELKEKVTSKCDSMKRHYQFWMYLQNYFKQNKKTQVFVLDKSHFEFIQEDKGRMLSQFLNMHRQITTVLIGDLELNSHSIEWIGAILAPQVHIEAVYLSADHQYEESGMKLLESTLADIQRKQQTVAAVEKVSSKQIRKRSAALALELGIGPQRLDQLIQISVKALKALTKRQWAENRGYQVHTFNEVPFEAERDVFLHLHSNEEALRAELEALQDDYAAVDEVMVKGRGSTSW